MMQDIATPEAATGRVRVARSDALAGPGPHAASAGGLDIVFVRTASGLRAFQGRCPHQGALLGEGELDGETLVCRNHRWRFGRDGRRVGGPECLACYAVTEADGDVFVDLPAHADAPAKPRATRSIDDLPGPKGWPLVGNLLQLELSRL